MLRVRNTEINTLLGRVIDPSPRDAYLYLGGDYLMHLNILIDIYGTILSELPKEPWISNDLAYQLPAYYWTLRTMASRNTIDINPEDVINEIMRKV